MVASAPAPIFLFKPFVWKLLLRVLVQKFHVRVRRSVIQVVVAFLDILTMIPFVPGEAKQALFENRIPAIPKCNGEAGFLVSVANTSDTVFVPPVRTRSGLIERQVLPGTPFGAVVFPYRPPRALA